MDPTKLLATLQNIIEGTASEEETQLASALFSVSYTHLTLPTKA